MFETVGEIARWRMVYPHLRDADVDSLLEYDALSDILGVTDRQVIQNAVRRAGKELLQENRRAIEAVPNQGYRVVTAGEHLRLSKKQVKRSRRAIGRGKALVIYVNFNEVPVELRPAIQNLQVRLQDAENFMRRVDAKLDRHKALLDDLLPTTQKTQDEVDRILARLNKAGIPD